MANMRIDPELPGHAILLAVISTSSLWTLVYFMSWMVWPHKRALWHSLVVVFIHGVLITLMAYVYQMSADSWPYSHPGEKSTNEQTYVLIIALGFFLFEFGWYLANPRSKSLNMWVHHICTIIAIAAPLYYGDSGAECCGGLFITEVSIPSQMTRWFMREAKCRQQYVLGVEYIFLMIYLYFRVIIGTPLTYDLLVHPNTRLEVKLFGSMLWVVSLIFFKTSAEASIKHTRSVLTINLE